AIARREIEVVVGGESGAGRALSVEEHAAAVAGGLAGIDRVEDVRADLGVVAGVAVDPYRLTRRIEGVVTEIAVPEPGDEQRAVAGGHDHAVLDGPLVHIVLS